MDMGNNTGIGFKIFGLFMVFVVAIVIDIAIFNGGIDLDEFSYIFDEIFYTDYEDDDWVWPDYLLCSIGKIDKQELLALIGE